MKNKIVSICRVCGNQGELSFEHVPPKSCYNDKPIYMHSFETMFDTSSHHFGKPRRSPRGMGQYTLCEHCNNITGGWYVPALKEWTQQGAKFLDQPNFSPMQNHVITIKPLNILKEVVAMFMSADDIGVLRDGYHDLPRFVLNQDKKYLPKKFRFYAYYTDARVKRYNGYAVSGAIGIAPSQISEISFRPFGYLMTMDSPPAHPDMFDMTDFKKFQYDEVAEVNTRMPFLETNTLFSGEYSAIDLSKLSCNEKYS